MIASMAVAYNSEIWIFAVVSWLVMISLVYFSQRRRTGVFLDRSLKWLELAVFGAIHVFVFVPLKNENVIDNVAHAVTHHAVCVYFVVNFFSKLTSFLLAGRDH